MSGTTEVNYKGFQLRVSYSYDKGFKGSLEEPPEPETLDLEKVELAVLVREKPFVALRPFTQYVDITDLLEESQFHEIELIIRENAAD